MTNRVKHNSYSDVSYYSFIMLMDTSFHTVIKTKHTGLLLRILVCFIFIISLAGCGGSGSGSDAPGTYSVNVSVSGLQGTLVLANNADTLTLTQSGAFSFTDQLASGASYNVTVQSQPAGQFCLVNNGSGTITSFDINSISVTCASTFLVSGTVTGLNGTLILRNNGTDELTLTADGSFTFSNTLANSDSYSVMAFSQPAGQFCAINNSSGVINGSDITNMSVTCTNVDCTNKYSIGGSVSGLSGELGISNNGVDGLLLTANGSFNFNKCEPAGQLYNVQVSQQPSSQICSITNASGVITNTDISDINILCTSNTVTVTLSGSYQITPLTRVDSDINDADAPVNVSNNTSTDAQIIPNFVRIQGFATSSGTGRPGDRFESTPDEDDIYKVELVAGQTVRMQIVDFAAGGTFQGDLDLYLYNSGLSLVDSSLSTDEYEVVTAPSGGIYYIDVFAYDGSSKYVLSLDSTATGANINPQSMDFEPEQAIVKFRPSTTNLSAMSTGLAMKLSHQRVNRAALAHFDTLPPNDFGINSTVSSPNKLTSAFRQELAQQNPGSYAKLKTLQRIKQLRLRTDVEYAEPNYIYRPLLVPNDSYYNLQWHYPAIKLPQTWDITTGLRTPDVIVAVIDTGVYLAHPEFTGQLVDGYDFISNASNALDGNGIDPIPDDPGDSAQIGSSSWHGTHVAGTIAARSNNSSGVSGIAWNAKIMPLRALGLNGGTDYDIQQAIRFAAGLSNDSGTVPPQVADVINLSLGGSGYSQSAQDTFDAARAAGVIVVAAAGNENTSQLSYPASYDGVISVSATDYDNNRAPYSNYGSRIDVAAPGGDMSVDANNDGYGDGVLSTLVDDSTGTRKPTYAFYQGTSMASPHVAGVIALMRAVDPALTPDEMDALITSGTITDDIGASGRDNEFGYGLINALQAVQEAQLLANGGTPPPQPAIIVATPNQLNLGLVRTATVTLSNEGDASASITSVQSNSTWLSVAAATVDPNGLGDYDVTIIDSGLADSLYQGKVTFTISNGNTVVVPVTIQVGTMSNDGEVGQIYLLLLDPNNNVIAQTLPVDLGTGVYSYSFNNINSGDYNIVGGSDIDFDQFICQLSEACGGYPTIEKLETINVLNTDITNLDFVVDILSNLGSASVKAAETQKPEGIRRPPVQTFKQFAP